MTNELTDEQKKIAHEMERREQAEKTMLEQHQADSQGKSGGNGNGNGNGNGELPRDFIIKCLFANDLGDGQLYAKLHRGRYVYVASSGKWLLWQGHYWTEDTRNKSLTGVEDVALVYRPLLDLDPEEFKAHKLVSRKIDKLRSKQGRKDCREMAASCTIDPLVIDGDEIDTKPWDLACPNGVIKLKNHGRAQPGEPEDYLKKNCPTDWQGLDAEAPHWEQFLREITENNEDLVDYLHRLLGYAITGLTVEHVLPIIRGRGRNGKGVLFDVLSYVLGDLAKPIRVEMLLDTGQAKSSSAPTPDIMALHGLRIAFASESDRGARFSVSKVKWLTGGDELTGRSPHDKFEICFRPVHLLFISSNRVPFADPDDYAFWQRAVVLHFPVSYRQDGKPEKDFERVADKYLSEKLKQEASGILAWLVRGCLKWQAEGLWKPDCVIEETKRYRLMLRNFEGFLEECCYFEKDCETSSTDMYELYKAWYMTKLKPDQNEDKPTQTRFGLSAGKHLEKHKTNGRWFYVGVGLDPSAVDFYLGERSNPKAGSTGQQGIRFSTDDDED